MDNMNATTTNLNITGTTGTGNNTMNNNLNSIDNINTNTKVYDIRADYIRYYRQGQETILVDTIAALDEILSYESSTK